MANVARGSYLIDKLEVDVENLTVQSVILCAVGVAHVVDAKEGGEQAVIGGPAGNIGGGCVHWKELCVDLMNEVKDGGQVLGNQGSVHRSTTICQVVCLNKALVIFDGQVVYPAGAVDSGVAGIWRVSERIG